VWEWRPEVALAVDYLCCRSWEGAFPPHLNFGLFRTGSLWLVTAFWRLGTLDARQRRPDEAILGVLGFLLLLLMNGSDGDGVGLGTRFMMASLGRSMGGERKGRGDAMVGHGWR